MLVGSGVRVFGGFGLDDEPLVVAVVLVAVATTAGRAAVAVGTGVLVAVGALGAGVRLGVRVGVRVGVLAGRGVAVGVGVAAPAVSVTGGAVGDGAVGASGSRSPIVPTRLISGWITDRVMAVAVGGWIGTPMLGRGAAVSLAASSG